MTKTKLPEKVVKLIDGKNFANIAFVMNNGSPHVSAVWVDRDGGLILVNTAEDRVKSKYLKQNTKIALSIFDQDNPYENVEIWGHVVERTKTGASEHIDKMAKKYMGKEKYPYNRPGVDRILLKIEPDRISKEMG
jgi:PPOX class probable F420-dependent enzyme